MKHRKRERKQDEREIGNTMRGRGNKIGEMERKPDVRERGNRIRETQETR